MRNKRFLGSSRSRDLQIIFCYGTEKTKTIAMSRVLLSLISWGSFFGISGLLVLSGVLWLKSHIGDAWQTLAIERGDRLFEVQSRDDYIFDKAYAPETPLLVSAEPETQALGGDPSSEDIGPSAASLALAPPNSPNENPQEAPGSSQNHTDSLEIVAYRLNRTGPDELSLNFDIENKTPPVSKTGIIKAKIFLEDNVGTVSEVAWPAKGKQPIYFSLKRRSKKTMSFARIEGLRLVSIEVFAESGKGSSKKTIFSQRLEMQNEAKDIL